MSVIKIEGRCRKIDFQTGSLIVSHELDPNVIVELRSTDPNNEHPVLRSIERHLANTDNSLVLYIEVGNDIK